MLEEAHHGSADKQRREPEMHDVRSGF
ncbi:hypothetical protein JMJ78_0000992 [Colletotrichum scovillei]|nr:hypothetical protein JMJ78_0000992 [Colletotrichum scovillei]